MKKIQLFVLFMTILSLFGMLSCDIGLGSSVDTEAPSVTITYPPDLSVIKGMFKLAGVFSDDMKVTTIKVTVTNNDSGAEWQYEVAPGKKSGDWELELNEAKENNSAILETGFLFPDGKNYKADVTAYDGSNHTSGTASRSFVIDNTAPVLILSSPAKIGAEDASTYGRTLKLAGDISDDNTVSTLDLYLKQFDTEAGDWVAGAQEKHLAVTGFSGMSTDNPLIVAKYVSETAASGDENAMELRERYLDVYGTVSESSANADKTYYCRVVLTDNAKTFMTVGDSGTGTGNATSKYYINNDNFADNLMSEQSYSLTATKLRDLLKGQSTVYTATQISAIQAILSQSGYSVSSTELSTASSKIALNPDNNPTYTVSGYPIAAATETSTGFGMYTVGSTIYLNISAGRDKKYVVPSSVAAVLYKLSGATDRDVSDTAADDTFVLVEKGSWVDEAGLSCDKNIILTTAQYPKLSSNQYYKLVVTGRDRDGNMLDPSNTNGFGFKLRIAGNPPVLEVGKRTDATTLENVKDSEYVTDDALRFSGAVSSETNTIKTVSYEVKITDGENTEVETLTGDASAIDGSFDGMNEAWSFALADNADYNSSADGTEYEYTVKIVAVDDNGASAVETRRIHVDKKAPVVAITEVSPLAGTNKNSVNGTITIVGSITETYKLNATLCVSDGIKKNTYTFDGVQQITQTIDTTDYADKSAMTFTLNAVDKAGNVNSSTVTTTNVPVKVYTVDQSTDQPIITLTNADITIRDTSKIAAGINLFSSTNNALSGTITDDDGIASVVISYATASDGTYTPFFANANVGGGTSYPLSNVLFKGNKDGEGNADSTKDFVDGLYYLKITVKDKAQESTGYCNNNTNYFVVAVDEGAPSISVTNTDGMYQAVGQSFTVKGKTKDSGGNIKIYCSADNVLSTTGATADRLVATITGTTEQEWSDLIAVASNATVGATLYYIAVDSFNQNRSTSLSYLVDPYAPTFTVTRYGSTTTVADMPTVSKTITGFMQQGAAYVVTGTVADTGDSKLDGTVYYRIATTEPDKISGINAYDLSKGTWLPGTAQGTTGDKWKLNLDFSALTEGTPYTVYVIAKDNAGNVSLTTANPCANIQLTPDGTAPVIGSLASSDAQIVASESGEDVTITASDLTDYYSGTTTAGSGIGSVVLYENGSAIGTMATADNGVTYTYTFTKDTPASTTIYNAHLSTGTHTFVARATDKVGNVSADTSVSVSVDVTSPVVNITGVTPITTSGKVNGKVTITGNATDETALASPLSWKVVASDNTSVKTGTIAFDNTSYTTYYGFTLELDTSTLKDTNEAYLTGNYTIEITATDKAGNASSGDTEKRALSIDQSTDTPVITLSNADTTIGTVAAIKTAYTGNAAKTNIFTTTNTKLIGTITDDDGIDTVTVAYRKSGTQNWTSMEKSVAGSTSYSLEYALPTTEAAYEVKVTVKDTKQETSVCNKATDQFMIAVDAGAPVFSVGNANGTYYKAGATLAVSGTVKEASAVTFTTTGGKTPVVANGVFSDTITVAGNDTTSVPVQYTATDAYGQASTASFTYGRDSTAPAAVIDGTNTLTVGGISFTSSNTSAHWFNTTSLAFSGYYKENGSGIAECSYFLNPTTIPNATNIAELTPTGTFSTAATTGDTCKFNVSISNFSTSNSGVNSIYFAVKDNAGNYVVSDAYVIKIDQDAPIASCSTSGIVLTNGASDLTTVSGTCSDASSGVSSVVLKIGSYSVTASVTGGSSWTASITKEAVLSHLGTSTYPVTATITDSAGNVGTATFFSIQVDKTAPSAAISTALATTKVNGKKTLSGTVTEENKPNSIALYYYSGTDAPASLAGYTLFKAKTTDAAPTPSDTNTTYGSATADIYNWTFSDQFNFDTYADATGIGTVWLLPVVYDAAGNCNISDTTTGCAAKATKYAVDRNADRPVIKLSNFSVSNSLLKNTSTALGTISDDDGISKFWITSNSTAAASAPGGTDASSLADGWVSVAVTDGSWSVNAGADGSRTWYFYVKDTESGTFTTKSTSSLVRPYIIDSTTTTASPSADNSSGITFSVDTTAPSITSLATYRSSSSTAPAVDAADWTTATTTFGGSYRYLYAKVVVSEAVGMNTDAVGDIALSIGGNGVILSASDDPKITRTHDGTSYTYIIGPVTVSTLSGTGVMSIAVTASDGAQLTSSKTMNINKDGDGPTISITTPKSDAAEYVTSSATITGTVSDSGSGVSIIKYCVPTKAQINAGVKADTVDGNHSIWTTLSPTATVSIPLAWGDISRYCNSTYATAATGNLVTIPVYFYAADDAGNSTIKSDYKLYVDTEASKASTGITYPTDGAAISSSVTVYGTASDDVSVSEVWVQLDVNGDGAFDANDYAIVKGWMGSGFTLVPSEATVTGNALSTTDAAGSWHIKATGTNSWKLPIDASKISYTLGAGETLPHLGVRAISWDGTYLYDAAGVVTSTLHIRSWPTYVAGSTDNAIRVTVDTGAPKIGDFKVVQYDGSTAVKTLHYSSGMYISGVDTTKTWKLEGTVTDDKALDACTFTDVASTVGTLNDRTSYKGISDGGDAVSKAISVALTTSSTGKIYSQMVVTDTTGKTNQQYFIINVDNTAPAMYTTGGSAVTTNDTANTTLRVKNTSSQNLGNTYVVENSDGSFTMGDTVTEADAGLLYLAFFFERQPKAGSTTKNRVYNPMFKNDNNSTIDTTISSGTTAGQVYINSDHLACMYVTGTTTVDTTADTTTLTATDISSNANVRVGGLIKFQGVYRRISAVSGSKVTFSPATTAITTADGAKAELIYAQVVDHNGIEISDAYGETDNGDGDGMNEVLKVKGSTYTWQATIASDNIPDGPAIIHVVAIDAAGNMSGGTVTTSIANNRPRIAKVLLGTDLNGSGYFDYYNADGTITNNGSDKDTANNTQFGEFVYYSTLNKSTGKEQSLVTVSTTKPFVVKNGLCVLPEFVGGNGVLKYGYGIENTAATSPISGTSALAAEQGTTAGTLLVKDKTGTAQSITTQIQTTKVNSAYQYGGVVLTDNSTTTGLGKYESWTTGSKTQKYLSFTFWDVTEETTQGTDSLWAMVNIPAYINVTDDVAPTADIKPFYWNSWTDCSTAVDTDGTALGHIDLEADINSTKPGVSGEVCIEGTAYDDTRLGSLFMTTPGSGETHQVALYKNGAWLTGSDTDTNNSQPYSTTWSWPTHWKSFEITSEDEPSQDGHTVTWKFTVDMTKYGVASNQTVQVTAKDASTQAGGVNISASSTTQTTVTKQTPYYEMDFVPYIKDVASAYRSRLGRYPVQAGASITIEGYNFAQGANYTVNFYRTDAATGRQGTTAASTAISGTITTDGEITVTAPQYSCFVSVTTGPTSGTQIATQNNVNSNSVGYNIQKGFVATDTATYGATVAAAAGTDFWADDCYLSVWNVDTAMSGSVNPTDGTVKKITSTNSGDSCSIRMKKPDTTEISTISGLENNTYATWGSPDLQLYSTILGNSTYTKGATLTQNKCAFTIPTESLDMCIIHGTPWFVMLDNYVSGEEAATWAAGLFLAREGFMYPKNKYDGGNTVTDTECVNILEKQGNNNAADNRDSSTGYDSVLNQFINPRMAGYYSATDVSANDGTGKTYTGCDYIFVSYYDSYARCLKYAAYKEGHGVGFISTEKWGNENGTKSFEALGRTAGANMKTGYCVVAGYDTLVGSKTAGVEINFAEEAGEWSDIAVDPSDHYPVIVYYNKTRGTLEVAHGKQRAPVTGNVHATAAGAFTDNSEISTGWTKTKGIKPSSSSDFGRYVSCTIDDTGNLHVAAQDTDNGALYYLYLTKNTSNTYTTTVCQKVDGTESVGSWTDIELTTPSGTTFVDCKPVITYLNTARLQTKRAVKAAYIASSATVNGTLTAYWEAMTDPAKYEGYDQKTNALADVYETQGSSYKSKIGVGFNSNMLAVDYLRNEQ